jgi:MFS family permease
MGQVTNQRARYGFFSHGAGMAGLMGLIFGTVMFDRRAIGFLSPFIIPDLHLTNAQLGVAAAATSLTWALAGFPVGRVADKTGRHKSYLIAAILGFSLVSAASGLAAGFLSLVAIRLCLGLAEGPVPPLMNTLVMGNSANHRRGLNIGILSFFSELVGATLAPIVLVGLASHFGWRATFFLVCLPGLVLALGVRLWLPDEAASRASTTTANRPVSLRDLLRNRNILLGAAIAALLIAFLGVTTIFLPLYLVRVRHLTAIDMGLVMSVFGAASLLGGLVLPAISDRFGRKPVLVVFAALGVLLPLGCVYWTGGTIGFAAICAAAALPCTLPHLIIGIIPGESVAASDRAAATGLVMGIAELVGGFATPSLGGLLADRAGLAAVLVLAGACAAAASFLSLLLLETAPRFHAPRSAVQVALETP